MERTTDGTQLLQRYILLFQIGEGQYGKVFKAMHRRTGVIVAVKIVSKKSKTAHELDTYREEMRLLQPLQHQHIIRLIEYFETDDYIYIVTEFCKCDLAVYFRKNGGYLRMEEVRTIGLQMIAGLKYLHSRGIIHHDLKPQNALIGCDGRVKLCDLGLATQLKKDGKPLYVNTLKGKYAGDSPVHELIQKSRYTYQADFWSLGVVLYELFVGRTPFRTTSLQDLKYSITKEPIVWPKRIPPQLHSFLDGLLQQNTEKRFTWKQLRKHPFLLSTLHEEEAMADGLAQDLSMKINPYYAIPAEQASTEEGPSNLEMSNRYSSDNNPTKSQDYGPNKATAVKKQVDEVVGIMQDNINKVMAREGQLENLQDKTDDLHQGSMAFKQKASGVRRKMKWRDMKLKIIIAIVVVILIVVIAVPIAVNKK
ncbi:serine/threonine protein kinase [Mycoemilia scoparia]|uniref:non-specific serine/threonine protein kinase n=1 Tax=Mycoemilia scoparia TaxID=417184 RepID=A0A9W8A2W6_9FUNG|nr:serine/threonine protein kinase [Mycoemilia scoparia]